MKVYTRRGDSGETDLFGGGRVSKEHIRVAAYGEVDELNAFVGAASAASPHEDLVACLSSVQTTLFDIGSFLATPDAAHRKKAGVPEPDQHDVDALEQEIEEIRVRVERHPPEGATALDGDMPINMSGGVLSSNAIGASGMIRYAEAAMQVRGQAGEHQVDGARIALGHAYGGGSQYFSMCLFGQEKP